MKKHFRTPGFDTFINVPSAQCFLVVVNSRCHTQSGQEMDQIRPCDIGRRKIGPTVRLVDRALETFSEVGEKADYPVYQPCKKEADRGFMNVYSHWLSPSPLS